MQYSKEFDGFNLMNLSFQEREKLLKEQFSREKEKILKRRVLLFFPFWGGAGAGILNEPILALQGHIK